VPRAAFAAVLLNPRTKPKEFSSMPESKIQILIVDDDEEDCLLVGQALEESLPSVGSCFVGDGEELLDYLQHCETGSKDPAVKRCPNLILLDLNMPKMDGREALKRIKSDESAKSLPVVILSTSANVEDVSLCYRLGANSYLTKPFSYDALVRLMSILGAYWFNSVHLPLHDAPYFQDIKPSLKSTVLVVDDSYFSRNVLVKLLKEGGQHVIQAEKSEAALALYSSKKPDLVMLDYSLPQMSGSEVIAKLHEIDPKVKIIITTTDPSHITREQLIAKGVLGVLYKPFSSEATSESIDSALHNRGPDAANLPTGTDD
jgi:CheY-like chemotaxis protein